MLNGLAPWAIDGSGKINLHHRANQPDGPLDEMTAREHREMSGLLHDNDISVLDRAVGSYQNRKEYDDKVWNKQRARYWVTRAYEVLIKNLI